MEQDNIRNLILEGPILMEDFDCFAEDQLKNPDTQDCQQDLKEEVKETPEELILDPELDVLLIDESIEEENEELIGLPDKVTGEDCATNTTEQPGVPEKIEKETRKQKEKRKWKERRDRLRTTRAHEDYLVKIGAMTKEERDKREDERYLKGTLVRERGVEKQKKKAQLEKIMETKKEEIIKQMDLISKNS